MSKARSCLITIDAEEDLDTHNTLKGTYTGVCLLESTLQEILDNWHIKATFFVTGGVIKECTATIRALSQKNELAAHGLYHVPIVSLPPPLRKRDLMTLRRSAHRMTNQDLKGFRGVKNMIDIETIKILTELGFIYDSSVIPRYFPFKSYEGYGGKALTSPYHPSEEDYRKSGSIGIWELPITCARIMNFPLVGTWIRYIGPKITKLLLPDTNYVNIAFHSWDFIKTKKHGYRTGKEFHKILRDIIDLLYQKNFIFHTCSSLCQSLDSEAIH